MPHRIPADGNKIIRVYSTKEVDLLIQGVIQLQDSATNAPGGGGGGSVLWSTIVNNPFELVGVEQIGTGIFRYTSELRSDADVVAYYSSGGTAPDLTDLLTGAITIGSGKTLVHQDSSPTVIIQANGLINPAAIDGGIGGGTATWGGITGTLSDQTDLQTALDGKSNTGHTHIISEITNLQTALDGKSNTGHTHTLSEITDLASTTDLPEGTNLYYTTARANTAIDARVNKAFVDALNVDADTLDGLNSLQFLRSDQNDTIEGTLTIDSDAAQALTIKGGTADHVYIGLFADSAAQSTRSAYIGFPSGGSDTLTIANEQGTDISLPDNVSVGGALAVNGLATLSSGLNVTGNADVTGIITATGEIRSDDDIVAYYSSGGTAPDLTDLLTGAIVIGATKTLTHQSSSPTVIIQSNGLINPAAIDGGVGSGGVWGSITGTLSDQTDLQTALDGKSNTGHTHTAAEIASGILLYDRLPISSTQVANWGTAYDRSITGISNIIANAGRIRLSRQDGASLEDDLKSIGIGDARLTADFVNSDTLAGYMPLPSDSQLDKGLTPIFTQDWAGSSWGSVLTFKGWTGNYAVWQIAGNAATSTEDVWYLRTGTASTWNAWKQIAVHGDDVVFGNITLDTTGSANLNLNSGAGQDAIIRFDEGGADKALLYWDASVDYFRFYSVTKANSVWVYREGTDNFFIEKDTNITGTLGVSGQTTINVTDAETGLTINTSETTTAADVELRFGTSTNSSAARIGYLSSADTTLSILNNDGNVTIGSGSTTTLSNIHAFTTSGYIMYGGSTDTRFIQIGENRTGDGTSFIDLIGDTTYSDYGTRLRREAGAAGRTRLRHRGTGDLDINSIDSSDINLVVGSTNRLTANTTGVDVTGTLEVSSPVYGAAFKGIGGDSINLPEGRIYDYWVDNSVLEGATWKKICDVSFPDTTYRAMSMKVVHYYPNSNYGHSTSVIEREYIVSFRRSGAAPNDPDDAIVIGQDTGYIRVVKTATGVYELQGRPVDNYRAWGVKYTVLSSGGGTTGWTLTPATTVTNGSILGTVYTATPSSNPKKVVSGDLTANYISANAGLTVQKSGEAIILKGAGETNDTDNFYMRFQKSDGSSVGYLGVGSSGDSNMILSADNDLRFISGAGIIKFDDTAQFDSGITRFTAATSYLLSDSDSDRIIYGGGSAATATNGAYISVEGENYGGTGLGGDIIIRPSGDGLTRFETGNVQILNALDVNGGAAISGTVVLNDDNAGDSRLEYRAGSTNNNNHIFYSAGVSNYLIQHQGSGNSFRLYSYDNTSTIWIHDQDTNLFTIGVDTQINTSLAVDEITGVTYGSFLDFDIDGYIANSTALASTGSMQFYIDSDNNGTGESFTWLNDGVNPLNYEVLMTLASDGDLVASGTVTATDFVFS